MKLFVYEHCPYCIRVRVALAIKGVACEIAYLHDDDITAHTDKTGVKSVPILQKDDGSYMGESLDIIDYIDGLKGDVIFSDKSINVKISEIMAEMKYIISPLVFSYTHKMNFPELSTNTAKAYYINRYMKKIPYATTADVINDRQNLKTNIAPYLQKIADLIKSPTAIDGEKMGMNEVLLFSLLYTLTAVEDFDMPVSLQAYLDTVSAFCILKPFSDWG